MKELSEAERKVADLISLLNARMGLGLTATITATARPDDLPDSGQPSLAVELTGSGVPLLLAEDGALLRAIEYVAARILRLQPGEQGMLTIDAGHFNERRDRDLRISAQTAIASVLTSGQPYTFPPLPSRERRILHLELAASGLRSASTGIGPKRSVVLYPLGVAPPAPAVSLALAPGDDRRARAPRIDPPPPRRISR
jgi:spoIIIJ-associated protein